MDAVIWCFFLFGNLVHLILQIWAIVSATNSPAKTWSEVFYSRWPVFLARGFLCSMFFWGWLDGQLISGLNGVGIQLPGWVTTILALHVNAPVAGVAGYAADSVLAFIPWFKSSVPTIQ